MKQLAVTSKIIKSVYFSPEDGQLRICFKNGEERNFRDVPEAEVTAMCAAESPGQHYIHHISRQFPRIAA